MVGSPSCKQLPKKRSAHRCHRKERPCGRALADMRRLQATVVQHAAALDHQGGEGRVVRQRKSRPRMKIEFSILLEKYFFSQQFRQRGSVFFFSPVVFQNSFQQGRSLVCFFIYYIFSNQCFFLPPISLFEHGFGRLHLVYCKK